MPHLKWKSCASSADCKIKTARILTRKRRFVFGGVLASRIEEAQKSEWARHTWECVAPIHIRGYCSHPSNHLRRRIHQPSLLPHNIHRNARAVQECFLEGLCHLVIDYRSRQATYPALAPKGNKM